MEVPDVSRESMIRDLSTKQKWGYMDMHREKLKTLNVGPRTPKYFVTRLTMGIDDNLLNELYISFNTEPVEWLEEFLASNGIYILLSKITAMVQRKAPTDKRTQDMLGGLLLTIVALLVTKQGKQVLLVKTNDALSRLVLCLDPTVACAPCRMLLYDHFSFLCYSDPRFYSSVYNAMCYYKFATREKALFLDLVEVVLNDPVDEARVCCLRFINVLINTPEDLDDRMRVRHSFDDLRLNVNLASVGLARMSNTFRREFKVFLEDAKQDQLLLVDYFGVGTSYRGTFDDGPNMTPLLVDNSPVVRDLASEEQLEQSEIHHLAIATNPNHSSADTIAANRVFSDNTNASVLIRPLASPVPPLNVFENWKAPVPIPKRQMKVLDWSKVPNSQIKGTIWESLRQDIGSPKFDVDFTDLESKFCRVASSVASSIASASPSASNAKLQQRVTIISEKRSKAVEIFLKSIRMTADAAVKAITSLDGSVLTIERMELVLSVLPSNIEISELGKFCSANADALSVLASPDRFLWLLSRIPSLPNQLEGFYTLLFVPYCVNENAPKLAIMCNAIAQVRESKRWPLVLTAVLTVGNFVNGRSEERANAVGVKLGTLAKLCEMKAHDETTLLHYVFCLLEKSVPDALRLAEDLPCVFAASKISLFCVLQECSKAKKMCDSLSSLAQQVPWSESTFHNVVNSQLIIELQNQADQLNKDALKCLTNWQMLGKYYSEDPALITSKDFFGSICLFLHHFKKFQVQHLPKSPQASYDIHTSEMMECMRQGELAEIRRTLRRNNGPAVPGSGATSFTSLVQSGGME
jgi:hypothetical protein